MCVQAHLKVFLQWRPNVAATGPKFKHHYDYCKFSSWRVLQRKALDTDNLYVYSFINNDTPNSRSTCNIQYFVH